MERDPTKRKVKPAQALYDFEDLGESSDDSDFRIEDHCEDSDDDSIDSTKENDSSGDSTEDETEEEELVDDKENEDVKILYEVQNTTNQFDLKNALQIMICSICLGDRSDSHNEIIECDKCGVTVHEGCYGVQESDSMCSTDSPNPTTPWFCDACKAGVLKPECQLCPNLGGIFKETDVGQWVHLVCALYMPGVAFAEVDRLSSVTLFEMSYTKWGAKPCSLCLDDRLATSGVVIGCDAGLCKTMFHVTCGQREGLLSEAHSEEVDQADPFYAHCKLHSDRTLIKKRKRNWLALQMRMEEIKKHGKPIEELARIERRLAKYTTKYLSVNSAKPQPWVPTQKMARLLPTSASACRKLWRKGELSGADLRSLELSQAQIALLSDVHRRWHIPPAFNVEFIAYYLDRNGRVNSLRKQVAELTEERRKLLLSQAEIEEKRDSAKEGFDSEMKENKSLRSNIEPYHNLVRSLVPDAKLPNLNLLGRPILYPPTHPSDNAAPPVNAKPVETVEKVANATPAADTSVGGRGGKKRRREKHHRYSPELGGESNRMHKHKHKKAKETPSAPAPANSHPNTNSTPQQPLESAAENHRQSLKICFKAIPHAKGEGSSYVATPSQDLSTLPSRRSAPPAIAAPLNKDQAIVCIGCHLPGNATNLVRCDECLNGFHFACLDPPVKKSPKVKGYSWHCANCDPTESDD